MRVKTDINISLKTKNRHRNLESYLNIFCECLKVIFSSVRGDEEKKQPCPQIKSVTRTNHVA